MDSIAPSKRCTKCGETDPAEFNKNRLNPDGLQSWCRACLKAHRDDPVRLQAKHDREKRTYRQKRAAMADEIAEQQAQRDAKRQARIEAVERNGKRCARCKQKRPATAFEKNPRYIDGYQSYCRDCMTTYHAELRTDPEYVEKDRKRGRDHYHQHRETIAPKRRAHDRWRWHNDPRYRERKNIEKHRRREYIRSLTNHFTQDEWQELCEKYGNRCLKCDERKPLTVDHIIPVSKGGTNDIQNVQPLCLNCNMRKHTKTIDYRPLRQLPMEWD